MSHCLTYTEWECKHRMIQCADESPVKYSSKKCMFTGACQVSVKQRGVLLVGMVSQPPFVSPSMWAVSSLHNREVGLVLEGPWRLMLHEDSKTSKKNNHCTSILSGSCERDKQICRKILLNYFCKRNPPVVCLRTLQLKLTPGGLHE